MKSPALCPALFLAALLWPSVPVLATSTATDTSSGPLNVTTPIPVAAPLETSAVGDTSGHEAPATSTPSLLMRASRVGSDSLFPFLALTELGLATSDDHGGRRAARGAMAIVTTGLATELLKRVTHEKRPNGEDDKSFPSGHASLSFAAATLLDAYRPGWKGAGYATATWISVSRVPLKAHYWHDVAAGALLGHLITREFTGKYRGDGRDSSGASGGVTAVPAAASQSWALGVTPLEMPSRGGWQLGIGTRAVGLSRAF